jgi:hypothetical protein
MRTVDVLKVVTGLPYQTVNILMLAITARVRNVTDNAGSARENLPVPIV